MALFSARNVTALFLVGVASLGAGCERDKAKTDAPVYSGGAPTMKTTVENDAAIRNIASARCQRELACNNVGTGKKYESSADCNLQLENKLRSDLDVTSCRGGVVKKELEECLGEISNNECNNPKDALEQLAACRTSDLCKAL